MASDRLTQVITMANYIYLISTDQANVSMRPGL